jgi:hypothetical protein
MFQDYKLAYSEKGDAHKEEAGTTKGMNHTPLICLQKMLWGLIDGVIS